MWIGVAKVKNNIVLLQCSFKESLNYFRSNIDKTVINI